VLTWLIGVLLKIDQFLLCISEIIEINQFPLEISSGMLFSHIATLTASQ
jgi:hypothetical protein